MSGRRDPQAQRLGAGSGQGGGVDDEAVAHVRGQHPLVGLVDPVGGDQLGPRDDAVLGAEVEHLLGLGDAADHRPGVGAPAADEGEDVEAQRLRRGPDVDQGPVDGEQGQVGVHVDHGADGVEARSKDPASCSKVAGSDVA
ncbi:hypothetical protein CDFC105_83980 [Clostridioides difficile]|nr:hypothetical protein CDFC105_83980 [Clostridioides difficile]